MTKRSALALVAVAALSAACASGPTEVPVPAGVPGFDTRDYPGDAAMRTWRDASPYRWVGYYLPAPCYAGSGWAGRRAALRDMGWGFAVLFVGQQDWTAMGAARLADTASAAAPDTITARCTARRLDAANAAADAAAAIAATAGDGFPHGTAIFLDVERVERVSDSLAVYVRAWTAAVLADGRFSPGLYAHDRNVPELVTIVTEEYLRRQRTEPPPLWVAKTAGFERGLHPTRSGYPIATAWQGVLDTAEIWGGRTLRIDVNSATSADPSRGR